jgi:hypothetical protein
MDKKLSNDPVPERAVERADEEKFIDLRRGGGSDEHIEDLAVGKQRSSSTSSLNSTLTENDDRPPLTQIPTSTSIPASVMNHNSSGVGGVDLEKGPTGPKNKTIDEDGKVIVNWESLSDPENPKNWTRGKKIFNVVVISMMTFLCPLCSAMFVRPLQISDCSLLVCLKLSRTLIRPKCWLPSQYRCS